MGAKTDEGEGRSDWKDWQIGICRELDWTNEEIGDLLGISGQAVWVRTSKGAHALAVEEARNWTKTAAAKYLAKKVRDMEAKADVKARIHSKGYKVIEKALDHGLKEAETVITADGDVIETPAVEISAIHLKAADMGIERVEGKALDLKKIESSKTVTHVHTLSLAEAENIFRTRQMINVTPEPKQIAPPVEPFDA